MKWYYVLGGMVCMAVGASIGWPIMIMSPIIAGVVMAVAESLGEES